MTMTMTAITTRMPHARPQTLLIVLLTVKEEGGKSPEDNNDDDKNSNTSRDDTSKPLLQSPIKPSYAYTRV
jgi:hypothetical protein